MALPRPSSPAVALRDLRAFLATRERHQLVFAALAVLMPALIIVGLYLDSRTDPPGPQLIYANSWPATRSDDEIRAQQKIDQAIKDKALAEKRAAYQRLEKKLGME